MSWDVKYRCEWTDILGLDWRADIEDETAHSGDPIVMQATGTPLNIHYLYANRPITDNPILGTTADLNIYSDTNFQWVSFYAYGERKYRVSIYYSITNLYYRGYLNSADYNEPYDGVSYPVILGASDWLGQLKDFQYKDGSDYYNGRKTQSQIIFDILGKIGITTFKEFVGVYEVTMNDTDADSPLNQATNDVDVYRDKNCYEVLEEILRSYSAVIRQVLGEIIIYRPEDLVNVTIYGRVFTVGSATSAVTMSTNQLISRSTGVTDLRDVEGGNAPMVPAAKSVTCNFNYGNKDSWLDNWKFEAIKFHGSILSGYTVDNWTVTGLTFPEMVGPINVGDPAESEGIVFSAHRASSGDFSKYISQDFGPNSVITTGALSIEFDYQWFNHSGASKSGQLFVFNIQNGADFLNEIDKTYASFNTTFNTYITEDIADGPSGWNTYKRIITGLTTPGTYTIRFFPTDIAEPQVFIGIRDVKFIATSDEITIKKIKFSQGLFGFPTKWKKIFNYVDKVEIVQETYNPVCTPTEGKELNYDISIGDIDGVAENMDNIVEQFAGSIAIQGAATLDGAAADFVTAHAADYIGGGVVVTSVGADIIFTSTVAGVNFTGNTTITNTSGDLSGTEMTSVANKYNVARVDKIQLTGTSGQAEIDCGGLALGIVWESPDLAATAAKFDTDNSAAFNAVGINLSHAGSLLLFTANVPGVDFAAATISNDSGDLNGTAWNDTPNQVAVKRVDIVSLSGSTGTADILCDAVTEEVEITSATLAYSTLWNTRGGSENKKLFHIVGDSMAFQNSRPKMQLSIPIMENDTITNVPQINIIGNFQDPLNQISGANRVFAFDGGDFNVRDREWQLDLTEVIKLVLS
jgi:hypothetical protein